MLGATRSGRTRRAALHLRWHRGAVTRDFHALAPATAGQGTRPRALGAPMRTSLRTARRADRCLVHTAQCVQPVRTSQPAEVRPAPHRLPAATPGIAPPAAPAATEAPPPEQLAQGAAIATAASALIGTQYHFGGADEGGFDCSGLALYVHERVGLSIPRTAARAAAGGPSGAAVAEFFRATWCFFTYVSVALTTWAFTPVTAASCMRRMRACRCLQRV